MQDDIFTRRVNQLQEILADTQAKRVAAESTEAGLELSLENSMANTRKVNIARLKDKEMAFNERQRTQQAHALELNAMKEEFEPLQACVESSSRRSTELLAQVDAMKLEMTNTARSHGRAEVSHSLLECKW